uniref:Ribosomal protein eL8/eL30/eS12/Gadd45 domain-containing protein n=1 Tax=Denticeps clupeoides TaxID=299321 RepID=A0AAY4A1D7_9TELE
MLLLILVFYLAPGGGSARERMEHVSVALEELLVAARRQGCLTVGVYESAKLMNADPDCVVLCVLACDAEQEGDVALQIHFTLLRAFCCDVDINILRVSGMKRLADVLGESGEARDLHCLLVTNPHAEHLKLDEVGSYCEESRCNNQWVPLLALRDR